MANINKITSEEEYNALLQNNEKVITKLSADWCGPCKVLGTTLANMNEEALEGAVIAEVDVSDDTLVNVIDRYNVRGIPALIYIKNGEEVTRTTGALPEKEIIKTIKALG
jgi:thioredoxin 1